MLPWHRWDNYPEGRYQWLRLEELGGCTLLLARFVRRLRGEGWLPLPGGVDCLVAGPPCQHMSGLNRHANKIEVMKDAKNRIVLSVLSIVEHLRPPFALLEQVGAAPYTSHCHGNLVPASCMSTLFLAGSTDRHARPRCAVTEVHQCLSVVSPPLVCCTSVAMAPSFAHALRYARSCCPDPLLPQPCP